MGSTKYLDYDCDCIFPNGRIPKLPQRQKLHHTTTTRNDHNDSCFDDSVAHCLAALHAARYHALTLPRSLPLCLSRRHHELQSIRRPPPYACRRAYVSSSSRHHPGPRASQTPSLSPLTTLPPPALTQAQWRPTIPPLRTIPNRRRSRYPSRTSRALQTPEPPRASTADTHAAGACWPGTLPQ